MRKKMFGVLMMVALMALIAPAVFAENEKPEKVKAEPGFVDVPEGYIAVISPGGHSYVLLPGSADDFAFAENGITVLAALTEQGQRILDAAKLAADVKKAGAKAADDLFLGSFAADGISAESIDPLVYDTDCEGNWECGKHLCNKTGCSCVMVTGCTCSYWHEICTLQ